jgi:hypothetical protein
MELLPLPDVAAVLDVQITKVHQLLRDGQLVAIEHDGRRAVPAVVLQDGVVVKALPAVIRLLRDAHFADAEIVDWLLRPDDSLDGSAIQALRANHGAEVKRRAQVAGY